MSAEDVKVEEKLVDEAADTAAEATEETTDEKEFFGDEFDEDVDSEDSLTFSNGVIEKIVALAMRDVPGVVGMKGGFLNRVQDAFGVRDARRGVTVEVGADSAVRVNIAVFIAYGAYAPQVFEDVKHAVVKAVTGMTGLDVAGVNLRIEDVLTPEEIEARTPKLPVPEEQEALEAAPAAEEEPVAEEPAADEIIFAEPAAE